MHVIRKHYSDNLLLPGSVYSLKEFYEASHNAVSCFLNKFINELLVLGIR